MKVLTANRLRDGVVVYCAPSGDWTRDLGEAARFEEPEAAAFLQAALDVPETLVGPYLIDADAAGPVGRERLRERIRAGGPTAGSLHRETA